MSGFDWTSLIGPVISAGGGLLGGLLSSSGAQQGAGTQAAAQTQAAGQQSITSQQLQQLLAPFINSGYGAGGALTNLTGTGAGGNPQTAPLTQMFGYTPDQLSQISGYNFTKQQGQYATQNSMAGLGKGQGTADAGALDAYTTGLANQTALGWGQFTQQQKQQTFAMLQSIFGTGAQAAMQLLYPESSLSQAGGQFTAGAGQSTGAGQVASGNIFGSIAGSLPAYAQYGNSIDNMFGFGKNTNPPATLTAVGGPNTVNDPRTQTVAQLASGFDPAQSNYQSNLDNLNFGSIYGGTE